jgi:hypothetical protein
MSFIMISKSFNLEKVDPLNVILDIWITQGIPNFNSILYVGISTNASIVSPHAFHLGVWECNFHPFGKFQTWIQLTFSFCFQVWLRAMVRVKTLLLNILWNVIQFGTCMYVRECIYLLVRYWYEYIIKDKVWIHK